MDASLMDFDVNVGNIMLEKGGEKESDVRGESNASCLFGKMRIGRFIVLPPEMAMAHKHVTVSLPLLPSPPLFLLYSKHISIIINIIVMIRQFSGIRLEANENTLMATPHCWQTFN